MSDSNHSFQTAKEEIANSVSHGAGFLAVLVLAPYLIKEAVFRGECHRIIGLGVFFITIAFLYLSSALYHALPRGIAKGVFQQIEHQAIFLLIAGTYTPFSLGVLHGPWGWTLLGIIWTQAAVGILLRLRRAVRSRVLFSADPLQSEDRLFTLLYVAMGWTAVFAFPPLWRRMPHQGFLWLLLGGVAYTVGVPFYAADRRPYHHFIWHLFVLAGTAMHVWAVFRYAG